MLTILAIPYILLLIFCIGQLSQALNRSKSANTPSPTTQHPLSLIICTHNEPIPEVLKTLHSAALAATNANDEILLICDHRNAQDINTLQQKAPSLHPNLRILINNAQQGKKHAQRIGVTSAKNETIISIDADCSIQPAFFNAIRAALPQKNTPFMLLLPVFMTGDASLLGRMIEMEFVCLQMVSAGTALGGRPTMANGAGMVFSRALYLEHDARTDYASGDDMFLLQHAMLSGATIRFVADSRAVVSTSAPASLGAYLRQRTRWLSKAGGYKDRGVQLLAVVVFLANMAWPVAMVLALVGVGSWNVALVAFCLKLIADVAIFKAGLWLWPSKVKTCVALPLELCYPLMIFAVAFRSLRSDKKSW